MNKLSIAFAGLLMSATSGLLYAASEGKSVDIAVTYVNSIQLTGTVVGATRTYSPDDVRSATRRRGPHPTITLGTLGIESNTPGTCTLSFSTLNNFRLRHTVTNRRLTNYQLDYNGQTIERRGSREMDLPCNTTPSSLDFTAIGNFRRNVRAGVYSDTVTITVTTQ